MTVRPQRPAARLLVLDADDRLLMFRFTPENDRPPFWVTPGGAVDPGETFRQAATRELFEETGMTCPIGREIAVLQVVFTTLQDVEVDAEERYFLVRPDNCTVRNDGHTELEQRVMQEHRWFTPEQLFALQEPWYPESLMTLWRGVTDDQADRAPFPETRVER